MRVDFYQLGGAPAEQVIASIAQKLTDIGERLLVVAADEAFLMRLDRLLWEQEPTSFLPHAMAGGGEDARQPILLSVNPVAPNLARNMLIADGEWREAALGFHRTFYLFDSATLEAARMAWKLLAGRDGVERHYWAQEGGGWKEKA